MSTRSGKRIHKSTPVKLMPDTDVVMQSEHKTRSKKLIDNEISVKKRKNYVTYPEADDTVNATEITDTDMEVRRRTRRQTLKEHNDCVPELNDNHAINDNTTKKNKRGKKLITADSADRENIENIEKPCTDSIEKKKKKSKKKTKTEKLSVDAVDSQQVENEVVVKKKGKKKKKKSNSMVLVEDIVQNGTGDIKGNISGDSFHSAAGSPVNLGSKTNDVSASSTKLDDSKIPNNVSETNEMETETIVPEQDDNKVNAVLDNSIANHSLNNIENKNVNEQLNTTGAINENLDITITKTNTVKTSTEKKTRKKKKTSKNSTFEITEKIESNEIKGNETFDKDDTAPQNATYDKELPETSNSSYKKSLSSDVAKNLNSTYDKSTDISFSKTKSLDATYDKDNIQLNTTFDKTNENKTVESENDSKKSSLISSDATINITDDKSVDNSRISITSDESKTDNILNHTPMLIESSIDESRLSEDRKTPEKVKLELPMTPFNRESTFTKEEQASTVSPKPKISIEGTPTKRFSLPTPGNTPFPLTRTSQKDKTILNVTRSIEKSSRRSSLADLGGRQTKVMFCSPVNNPVVVSQVKGRVIKSNLKGSNKSFVIDDSTLSESRPTGRKRSHTHNEVETRAKRKRLADELQHSVDRLSRPRTVSAAAKLQETGTPSKKAPTPSKPRTDGKVSRTKLPNFAALHQKQFAKMESLDECQQRKARRARQLLTPTGSVGIIERISPQGTTPLTTAAPPTKEPTTKLHTPSKPKLPTLESINPGYTRFGFKLNIGVNPFTTTKKTENKPKETRKNGLFKQNTCSVLPSLKGATASRREVAKQIVTTGKSFTDKRNVNRKQNRTIIKGVRTNRRFELQMKLREVNA